MARNLAMGPVEWLLLVVLSILWGGSFFFAELALAELAPLTVVAGRVALAAVALRIVLRARGTLLPNDRRSWTRFFAMGALNNAIPFTLIVWAQTEISGGLASILNAATPLFTVLLAHRLTADERLTWNRLAGVLAGLAGVAVMIGWEALSGFSLHVAAELAVLAATLSYACAGIYGRRFKAQPPLVTAAGQLTASSLIMLPLAAIIDRPWLAASPQLASTAAIVGLALLCTALAYVIFFRILAAAGATNLLLVTLLIPVSAMLLGGAFLGETVEPRQLAGMALIAAGLALIDGRLFRPLLRADRPA